MIEIKDPSQCCGCSAVPVFVAREPLRCALMLLDSSILK